MTVILCTCNGKIGSQLNLEGIKTRLEGKGERVLISGMPCRDGIDPTLTEPQETGPIVIGGCLSDSCKEQFRDTMRKSGLDPFALAMVPLVGETSEERADILLTAAVERLKLFGESQERNLKPRFGKVEGNISRRQFITIPKIYYDLVPSIDSDRCRTGSIHCSACMKRCPSGAITVDERGKAFIEKNACTGCGICVRPCPRGAIQYPYFSPQEITAEIDTLLLRGDARAIRKQALLFYCDGGGNTLNDFLSSGGSLPECFLPVAIPCIGMLDAFFFMYSFVRGAVSVGMLSCSDTQCRKSADPKRLHNEMEVSSALLKELGVAGERLFTVSADSHSRLQDAFDTAERSLAELQKPDILCEGECGLGAGEHSLPVLLQRVTTKEVFIEGLPGIPSGMIRIADRHACTLCGVCEQYCPVDALRIEGNGVCKALRFSYAHCIGCAECIRRCPENALRLTRVINTAGYRDTGGMVLAEEVGLSCSECGKTFLTESMVRRLMEGFSTPEAAKVIRMCPDCRAREAFSELFT